MPLKDPKFRCAKCGSRSTDAVMMGKGRGGYEAVEKDFSVRYVPAVCTVTAIICALASLTAASHAAYLWYQAAKVRIEPAWKLEIQGPVSRDVMTGTMTAFHQASRLSQRAAIWTGVAALLGAISAVAGALPATMALFI